MKGSGFEGFSKRAQTHPDIDLNKDPFLSLGFLGLPGPAVLRISHMGKGKGSLGRRGIPTDSSMAVSLNPKS